MSTRGWGRKTPATRSDALSEAGEKKIKCSNNLVTLVVERTDVFSKRSDRNTVELRGSILKARGSSREEG
jgi:hypothetical protein